MAIGKEQKAGWALPLLAHCLVRLVTALLLIVVISPAILVQSPLSTSSFTSRSTAPRGSVPRRSASRWNSGIPWFWTLIGVDQALHHLTGFGLSIFMASN